MARILDTRIAVRNNFLEYPLTLKVLFRWILLATLFLCCNKINPVQTLTPTWSEVHGLQGYFVTSFRNFGNDLIAGAYRDGTSNVYLFLSTDQGSSWTKVCTIPVKNSDPRTHLFLIPYVTIFTDDITLFAGIGDVFHGDLYLSYDERNWSNVGISWPTNDTVAGEDINIFSAIGETIFAGTNNGVFRSTDHGMSWNAANVGFPLVSNHAPQVMRMVASGTTIFAGTTGEGIFRSTDSGVSWVSVDTGLTNLSIYGLAVIGTNIFAGAFQAPGNLSVGGVFTSTDSGKSWVPTNQGLTNHMINTLFASGTYLFAGTNIGVFRSTNYGGDWEDISVGSPIDSSGVIALGVSGSNLLVGSSSGTWRYLMH